MIIKKLDTPEAELIIKKLKDNNFYCPCKTEKIPENKCLCQEFLKSKIGICSCGLYEKIEI